MVLSLTIHPLDPAPPVLTRPLPDTDVMAQLGSGKDAPKVLTRPLPNVPFPAEKDNDVSAQSMSRPLPDKGKIESDATFQPVKDFTDYTKENYKAGQDAQSSPYLTIRLLGTLGAVTAPVGGVTHAVLSKPLERATGGTIPAEETDFLRMFTPAGAGAAAGVASRAIDKIPAAGKVIDAVKASPVVQGASKMAQEVFSPTTLSNDPKFPKAAGDAEGIIREQRGLAERSTEQAKAQLEPDYHYLSTMPQQDQLSFLNRIETASKSLPLADPRAEKAASNLRGIYQTMRNDLQADPNFDQMGFVQDYFPHYWEDPKKAQNFIQGWAKTGSGKNVQKRSIPTIEDGIKAGLVPKSTNPAEMTLQYIGNMYNYKALKGVQSSMADSGIRKFYPVGKQEPGWVELKGPGNENIVSTKGGTFKQVAYAPEDAARVYNRYYSPGFTGHLGTGIRAIRKVVNGATQLKLGLSAYHYRLIANESTAAAFSEGTAKGALKGTPFFGAVNHYQKGEEVEKAYLAGAQGSSKLDQQIIEYMTRAGGRMKGVDKTMDMSAAGSYWRALKDGSAKAAMKADAMNLKAGGPIKALMKTVSTVSEPLFMKVIPRIKNAVNYDAIAAWVKHHPGASDEEILKASRDIIDSTDNRFGELIQDNIFWDKKLKESLQLITLSIGWSLGARRETIGGAKDLAAFISGKVPELSQRAKYVLAAPMAHMLHASVYQYLKTHEGPKDLQDLVYPRTGGVSPYDQMPERANVPGQENAIINTQKHPLREAIGATNPLWQAAYAYATNEDFRGNPIVYQYARNAPSWLKSFSKIVLDAYEPISAEALIKGPAKGSDIGRVDSMLGSRASSFEKEDPKGYAAWQKKKTIKKENKGVQDIQRDENRYKP